MEIKEKYLFFNEYYERTSEVIEMTKSELKKFLNENLDYIAENDKKEVFAVENTIIRHDYKNITIL